MKIYRVYNGSTFVRGFESFLAAIKYSNWFLKNNAGNLTIVPPKKLEKEVTFEVGERSRLFRK